MTTERIRELIRADRLELFYNSGAWLRLRAQVLVMDHHECQECKKRGKYTRATVVHHVNRLKSRPELALSMWYESKGEKRRNLVSV